MASKHRGRIDVIDTARGISMLVVFLAHFVETYFQAEPQRTHAFRLVTRIASPAFVWISGITLGVLYARGSQWARTRDRLIDRAAFLLLVCHPAILGAYLINAANLRDGVRILFITDTIAVCLGIGVHLMPRLAPWRRATLGLALLLIGWSLTVAWNPVVGTWAWRIKDLLAGDWRDHWANYSFPLLPWLGFYLIATAAGGWFARQWDAGRPHRVAWAAAVGGAGSVALARALEGVWHWAAPMPLLRSHAVALAVLASPEKLPPTPIYFLRYGGLALILFALVLVTQETIRGQRVLRWSSVLGRCSVVAYVFQYYVYYGLEYLLPRPPERWAAVYFVGTAALIWAIVWRWERANGNRLITVGYPEIFQRFRSPSRPVVADASPAATPTPTVIPEWQPPSSATGCGDRG